MMLKRVLSVAMAILVALTLFAGLSAGASAVQDDFDVKNVILLIGSGMSTDHITATMIKQSAELNLNSFEYRGMIATVNSQNGIPDAASAATALACGYKTSNYSVAVSDDGEAMMTIAEAAKNAGKKVGIITNKNINDATTAAFTSHIAMKNDLYAIARQQITGGFDLFLGGGSYYFDRYAEEIESEGYRYIRSSVLLPTLTADSGKVFGAFSNFNFGSSRVPTLSQMVDKSTELLDNENGFFIVAEGGLIDTYSFKKQMLNMTVQLKAFDDAVGTAMEYVRDNPDTLLIVTGDCEAGSLTLNATPTNNNTNNSNFKSTGITNESVPFFAFGKNASAFNGEHENTDIPKMIAESFGIDGFADNSIISSDERDYAVTKLSSFSGWNFLNVRKNSNVAGIKLTTTTSNNAAVTAICSNGSMVSIMSNARVGYKLAITSPLASPYLINGSGSADLSALTGLVLDYTSAGVNNTEFTLTIGRTGGNAPFESSINITQNMINEENKALLPFESFTPAVTPDMAKDLDYFAYSTTGASAKITHMLLSLNGYTIDMGRNYYEVIALASSIDENAYTPDSYVDFVQAYENAKEAVTMEERVESKALLIDAIDNLEEVSIQYSDYPVLSDVDVDSINADNSAVVYAQESSELSVFCGSSIVSSVTLNTLPASDASCSGIRVRLSSDDYSMTSADSFEVVMTLHARVGNIEKTVIRPLMEDGYYYFVFDQLDMSAVSGITVSFREATLGAKITMSDFGLFTYTLAAKNQALGNEYNAVDVDPLTILRIAAGIIPSDKALTAASDIDGDGMVTVIDALLLLRKGIA